MSKSDLLNELTASSEDVSIVNLEDDMLLSISGGCTSSCGGPGGTTYLTSCVDPTAVPQLKVI
ncbi:MAG: hypothetical protein Tsb002_28850 [Wenzhouxiangellaceae bacterium]